ncbi:MAG: MSHA biogenesis protein MshK [Gammaproteobacteria bacterium]|nr:MSHA biogenesis protein MshK [Gammaproteobacteria bacterium]
MCKRLLPLLALCLALPAGAAEVLSDPTRPESLPPAASATPAPAAGLKLSLLRLGPKPMAVINGRVLHVGETLDGYRLVAVQPGRAILQGPEGPLSLNLAAAPLQKTKVRP